MYTTRTTAIANGLRVRGYSQFLADWLCYTVASICLSVVCNLYIVAKRCVLDQKLLLITYRQCCCQGLETQGRGQGRGLENWSSMILEDKDFPRGQQHCCEAVWWDRHELEPDRGTMANKPPIRHSVTARRLCFIFRMLR